MDPHNQLEETRKRRSKRGRENKSTVWNKVAWFSRRSRSSKIAGSSGYVSPLSDEGDYSSAWLAGSPITLRSRLDSDSSGDNEVDEFEDGYNVRRCKHYPNSEVVEQSCLRPSIAKALFMQLDHVYPSKTNAKSKSRRRRNQVRDLEYNEFYPHYPSDPEDSSSKTDCHCLACCSCTPCDRLNGVCPVYRRKRVSTGSLDKGLSDFENANYCDKNANSSSEDTKQSATLPKVNKPTAYEPPNKTCVNSVRSLSRITCNICSNDVNTTDQNTKPLSETAINCEHWYSDFEQLNITCDNDTHIKPDLQLNKRKAASRRRKKLKANGQGSIRELTKHISHDSQDTKVSIKISKTSPSDFKHRAKEIENWFCGFTSAQKNSILQRLLPHCSVPQTHLLCEELGALPHPGCPPNCQDHVQWLPPTLVLHIFSFLDPASLSRASRTCRAWYDLASEPSLWRKFCSLPRWKLSSRSGEQKQIIQHISPHTAGTVHWKRVFSERYRLHNNWMRGRCTVRTFEGHTQGVSCVQFDDTRIVSGSTDKTIKVWNIRTNSPWTVQTLVGHSGTVRCLHLEGNRLVSGSTDRTIKVWDLSTQHTWSSIACKVTMTGHLDTVRCLQVDDEKVISGSYDQTLKIWDIRTGHCRKSLRGHEAAVLCVRFDSNKIVSGSCDKTIKVWNFEGECLRTLEGHQDAVTCLQFDTQRIVSGSLDCTLKFWDIHTGKCSNTIDWKASEGHTGVVRCLQADSWRVVSASDDRTLKVWSLETGKRLVTLRNHSDGVTCLQFNDSLIVSGSYDKTVKLWDFSSV